MTNHRRHDLPQIDDVADFRRWLASQHIGSHKGLEVPWLLKPTQLHPEEFNPRRFKAADLSKPVVVTDDMFIVDGHHRRAAAEHYGTINRLMVIDRPFDEDLVAILNRYPGVAHLERNA